MLPITVIVVTKNEEANIERCLKPLSAFDQVIVVDSGSTDQTAAIALSHGSDVVDFIWNHQYPKKRQWCLDHLNIKHDFVFFVDADEVVTQSLIQALHKLDFKAAGYFVPGQYVWRGKVLRHGLRNRKIALIDRHKMHFPAVDDLNAPGMGEIEGHYQPVLKPAYKHDRVGHMPQPLLHYAAEDMGHWESRHQRYAAWESYMNRHNAWPADPVKVRQTLKQLFRSLPGRGVLAFVHSYIFKRGFLDGYAGLHFAWCRYRYYRMIAQKRP